MDGSIGPRIQKVADTLGYMGHAAVSNSLMASRWGKLINNACMSGMSAVCGATFGGVLDNDVARAA
jgi:2-dehydropantoate 2-reductase